jgi:hypothetical protein
LAFKDGRVSGLFSVWHDFLSQLDSSRAWADVHKPSCSPPVWVWMEYPHKTTPREHECAVAALAVE